MQQIRNSALIRAAKTAAESESLDPHTRVACWIISPVTSTVLVKGYNTFPQGIENTPFRWDRPEKYRYVVHAEANAIARAAQDGVSLKEQQAVLTLFPCASCCKLLIQSGVQGIIVPHPNLRDLRWKDDFILSQELLKEAGISVQYVLPDLL